jgi:bacterial/archaeal transporter family-2 protein
MASVFWALLGILAGAFVTIQAPINAELARGLGMPVAAAAISFLVGALVLVVVSLAFSTAQGHVLNWRAPAPWMFIAGGVLGAAFVTSTILLAPRLGATAMMAFLITGQLMTGLLLDRFGFLGLPVHEITPGRIAGVGLLMAGALLVRLT